LYLTRILNLGPFKHLLKRQILKLLITSRALADLAAYINTLTRAWQDSEGAIYLDYLKSYTIDTLILNILREPYKDQLKICINSKY
jgi:hypothetical protein